MVIITIFRIAIDQEYFATHFDWREILVVILFEIFLTVVEIESSIESVLFHLRWKNGNNDNNH